MSRLPRPGCVLRSALVGLGLLLLPVAVWFAYANWRRYWGQSLVLLAVGLWFLKLGVSRDEDSWISSIDDLGNHR